MNGKKRSSEEIRSELFQRYPQLRSCEKSIDDAFKAILSCYKKGGKLLIAGNGGSAADSDHFTGELTKSFYFNRAVDADLENSLERLYGEKGKELASHLEGGLPAIPLTLLNAANTAFANDMDPRASIAQLVQVFGRPEDIFIGITTSGNSDNIIKALMVSKAKGITSIVLTGRTGGKSPDFADICICAPEDETFKIQELHLPIYHALCLMVESELFEVRC